MTLNLSIPQNDTNLAPRITVIGVGGAGGNAVNNMIQSSLEGVEFLIANTDAQALEQSLCERSIQMGRNITQGLGAGSRPDIGRAAAEESLDEILSELEGANMVFITAGMGGGTGTGAGPVLARAAREAGILTVGVVTKPFHFEGVHRMRMAENGIQEMTQYVDTLIVIPNQNLFRVANEKTTFADAFKMADDVLRSGVRGVTDLMVMPGLINLDFADIRSVMTEMGKAMMGTGEAEGDSRALAAAEAAISNPLLDEVSMKGARGVLINITGGMDLTLFEVDEAANRIRDEVDPDANIIFGSTFDQSLEGRMRVSVVATGIDAEAASNPRPVSLSLVASRSERSVGEPQRPAPAPKPTATTATTAAPTASGGFARSALATAPRAEDDLEMMAATVEQPEDEALTLPEPPLDAQPAPETDRADEAAAADAPPEPAGNRLFGYAQEAVRAKDTGESEPRTDQPEAFIAPAAVVGETETAAPVAEARAYADPFAAAALANSARQAPDEEAHHGGGFDRKKAQRLFARMTGGASWGLGSGSGQAGQEEPRQEPTLPPAAANPPRSAEAAAARARADEASRAAPSAAAQPRLSGLETPERPRAQAREDDFLDIPAFLRRQAN